MIVSLPHGLEELVLPLYALCSCTVALQYIRKPAIRADKADLTTCSNVSSERNDIIFAFLLSNLEDNRKTGNPKNLNPESRIRNTDIMNDDRNPQLSNVISWI